MAFDRLAWQRQYRKDNKDIHTKTYEKTVKGFLMRLYRNMQSRIDGVQKSKRHLYEGKALLSRDEFYEWALGSQEFYKLFGEYVESGYSRKLAPSVDRIKSEVGYEISNMEWVTMSENSRRGTLSKWNKNKGINETTAA